MNGERVYLTFDVDWADDEVLTHVLDKLRQHDCKATFFVTHDSPLIRRLKEDPQFERGIHPNFNRILFPDDTPSSNGVNAILEQLKTIVPEAVSVRSHSLVHGTVLSNEFSRHGLQIDCNLYIPCSEAEGVRPWAFWNGMLYVPFVWSDYIDALQMGRTDLETVLKLNGVLKVVAFHPNHIYLNVSSIEEYERFKASGLSAREYRQSFRNRSRGIGDVFDDFLQQAARSKLTTGLISNFST